MATQPTIAKGYRIFYAPYAENMPTFNSDVWIEVKDTFVSLPNFSLPVIPLIQLHLIR